MEVNPSIFKGYDIRGRYPGELDEEVARKIGQAFAALLCRGFGGQRPIVIARDMRKSSPSLKTAILAGLFSQGAEVWDIGEVSIDVFYYALGMFDVPGIMVTASHNPKEWNGFKVYKRNGEGVDPLRLRAFVEKPFAERGGGKVEVRDVLPEYVKKIRGFFGVESSRPARTITVVIDAGNGMMGKIVPLVLDPECIEGVDLFPLYFELDGNFPHHPPNPLEEENLKALEAKVKETRADLGIAFDADGDRAVFLDGTGTPIRTSVIAALLAKEFLRRSGPSTGSGDKTVVYNVPSSRIVKETVEANGGRAVVSKVGHTHMKQTMQKAQAVFGAEHSGHYYFRDFFWADSGMIAALAVLHILSHSSQSISKLIEPFKTYKAIAEENFPVQDFPSLKQKIRDQYRDARLSTLDGLTIEYPDWWFNVRPSETEAMIRLNIEARNGDLLQEKYEEIKEILRESLP